MAYRVACWGLAAAFMLGTVATDAEAQGGCFKCFRLPNPKDKNPDRREGRPDTLEPSDGRDSTSRPTVLPSTYGGSRDVVPPQQLGSPQPGDVVPAEKLPP